MKNYLRNRRINVPFFISRRYLSSKKKKNVIHLITRISVVGIASITCALVILLSAFNGIEVMIDQLYSDFDPGITMRVKKGKSFSENRVDVQRIKEIKGVALVSRAIEAEVILKHEEKWVNAHLMGVDTNFLSMTKMSEHMVDGEAFLHDGDFSYGLIGASLLDKLGGFIPSNFGYENIICYVPKRDIKLRPGKNPFKTGHIKLAGRFNYNKDVNESELVISLAQAEELLEYENQINAIYISCQEGVDAFVVKAQLEMLYGEEFTLKTNREKNALIYQTSKSEKLIVMFILVFIFILAAFNLVASLIMLFVEKVKDINTMKSFGANQSFVFKIFFYEGLLISAKGIIIGLVLGITISLLQLNFGWLEMPNSYGEPFPIALKVSDVLLITFLVSSLSILFSYFPVRFLVKKNF